jgi:hypothetical protein
VTGIFDGLHLEEGDFVMIQFQTEQFGLGCFVIHNFGTICHVSIMPKFIDVEAKKVVVDDHIFFDTVYITFSIIIIKTPL